MNWWKDASSTLRLSITVDDKALRGEDQRQRRWDHWPLNDDRAQSPSTVQLIPWYGPTYVRRPCRTYVGPWYQWRHRKTSTHSLNCINVSIQTHNRCRSRRSRVIWSYLSRLSRPMWVRWFLNVAIRIVHIAPLPHYPNRNVFSDRRNQLYDW